MGHSSHKVGPEIRKCVLLGFNIVFNNLSVIYHKCLGRPGGLVVVERRTLEQEVGRTILTQVAVLYP